ncbi:MAG: hypothetical protein COB67_12620, partial [SAR324 cluster bacterium]
MNIQHPKKMDIISRSQKKGFSLPISIRMIEKKQAFLDVLTLYLSDEAESFLSRCIQRIGLEKREFISSLELADLYHEVEKKLVKVLGEDTACRVLSQKNIFNIKEAGELTQAYGHVLAKMQLSPDELIKKIHYHQEREALLQKHAVELQEKIHERDRELHHRIKVERKIQAQSEIRRVIAAILEITLQPIGLQERLQLSLEMILSTQFYQLQNKGSIFLADDRRQLLVMEASVGMAPELKTQCNQVAYGTCLCGKAILENKLIFADHVNHLHEITYKGILPHGHYSLPIKSGGKALGVLNIYLEEGHERSRDEENFLYSVANSLASMIERQNSEDQIREFTEELEGRVKKRTHELYLTNHALQESLRSLQETQDMLVQSEKVASLGELVSGVAHEMNTPLGNGITCVSYIDECTKKLKESYQQATMTRRDLEQYLDAVQESCTLSQVSLQRAADLVASFKEIAVDQLTEEKRNFKLKDYLTEIIVSLQPKISRAHHKVIIKCPEVLEVNSYPGIFAQILTHLVVNSLTHGFEKQSRGLITIDVTQEKQWIHLCYADDGEGIRGDHLKKIFDPFFTT